MRVTIDKYHPCTVGKEEKKIRAFLNFIILIYRSWAVCLIDACNVMPKAKYKFLNYAHTLVRKRLTNAFDIARLFLIFCVNK